MRWLAPLISFFANLFANVDGAEIVLPAFAMRNEFQPGSLVQSTIGSHYLDNIQSAVAGLALQSLGRLELLGNPLGLLNRVKTDLVDLLEQPAASFVAVNAEGDDEDMDDDNEDEDGES